MAQRTGTERHPAISKASVTDRNRSDSATARSQTRLRSPIKALSASLKDAVPSHWQCLNHAAWIFFFFLLHPQTQLPFWNLSPWNTEHKRGRTVFSVARDSVAKEQLGAQATPLVRSPTALTPTLPKQGGWGKCWGLGRAEHKGNPPLIPPSAEIGRARAPVPTNGRVPGRAWKTAVQAI